MHLFFLFLQLLQVYSYLGCLGQQRRIQQVISTSTVSPQTSVFFPQNLKFVKFLRLSVKNNSGVKPAGQCGTWVKEPEGGLFTSPNYPNKYPPNTECVYILEGNKNSSSRWYLFTVKSVSLLEGETTVNDDLFFFKRWVRGAVRW